MAIGWFIAFIILIVIELCTINLVTVWFAIGAVASMLTSIYTDSIIIQLLVFIVASLVALLVTRPLVKKFRIKEVVPTNSDRVIGEMATVVTEISKDNNGQVKVLGNVWTACCDEKVVVGTKVKVLAIDGVKLIVKAEED